MTKKKIISVPLDAEVLEKITDIQTKNKIFSRSVVLRDLINKGLETNKK